MVVPTPPVRVPSQRSLAPSVTSVRADYKGDNEIILGAMHNSHGIKLIADENFGKPQQGDP